MPRGFLEDGNSMSQFREAFICFLVGKFSRCCSLISGFFMELQLFVAFIDSQYLLEFILQKRSKVKVDIGSYMYLTFTSLKYLNLSILFCNLTDGEIDV